jgi:hypothetical protein
MTADGPRLIDWVRYGPRARRPRPWGQPHSPFRAHPKLVDDPERPRAHNAILQSEYARLAGMSPAALTAAMEPYIVRVFALLAGWCGCGPAQRERLIQRVEATLRSED